MARLGVVRLTPCGVLPMLWPLKTQPLMLINKSDKQVSSDWADIVDKFQKLALESRLGISIIYDTDDVHVRNYVNLMDEIIVIPFPRLLTLELTWYRSSNSVIF